MHEGTKPGEKDTDNLNEAESIVKGALAKLTAELKKKTRKQKLKK